MKLPIFLFAMACATFGQTGALAPVPRQSPLDNNGHTLAGACMYTYAAGTTTPQNTYSDSGLVTPNANPMVLDSSGRTPATYLSPLSYKFVFGQRSNGSCPGTPGTVLWSQDNVYDFGELLKAAIVASTGANLIGYTPPSAAATTVGAFLTANGFMLDTMTYSPNTLAGACTAAVAQSKTLVISKAWTSIPAQTLACALQFIKSGSIQPANGQTVTLTGAFTAPLTPVFDISAGGTIALASAKVTKVHPEWWGAIPDFVFPSTPTTDSCSAINAALVQGKAVQFSRGYYYSSCGSLSTLPSVQISGLGNGDVDCTTAATCIVYAAGVTGITIGTAGVASSVEGMSLYSLSAGAVSAGHYGIRVRAGNVTVKNVTVLLFGDDAWHADTDNVDHWKVDHSYFYGNHGNGWYCSSADCNGGLMTGSTRAYNNTGFGFKLAAGGSNIFIGNDATANTGGGYSSSGISNVWISPYCESAATFIFDASSSWSTLITPRFGECTYTNSGSPSNYAQDAGQAIGTGGYRMQFAPNSSGGEVLGLDTTGNNLLNACGVGDASNPCRIQNPFSTLGVTTAWRANNYIATETGANNAIVGALLDSAGNAITVADGLEVTVKLAHTLATGTGNTFNFNGHGADAIGSGRNPAAGLTTACAVNGFITLRWANANGFWVDVSQ